MSNKALAVGIVFLLVVVGSVIVLLAMSVRVRVTVAVAIYSVLTGLLMLLLWKYNCSSGKKKVRFTTVGSQESPPRTEIEQMEIRQDLEEVNPSMFVASPPKRKGDDLKLDHVRVLNDVIEVGTPEEIAALVKARMADLK